MPLPPAQFFVGLDWAAETHAVCVIDPEGRTLTQFVVEHSADGIGGLVSKLARFGDPIDVQVGIERPDGRLVDLLLEAGHPVVPVSPNAIKTWREGEVLSGAKSDLGDALVIAEYLRLRAHRLHVVPGYSAQTKALRTVVRTRDDLVQMRVSATNQLAALLDAHWPGGKAIFADIASPVALAFLSRYPTAAAARHLGEKRLASFVAKHGYSGRRTPAQLLARLRAAPPGTLDEALTKAVRDAVLALVAGVRVGWSHPRTLLALLRKQTGGSTGLRRGEGWDWLRVASLRGRCRLSSGCASQCLLLHPRRHRAGSASDRCRSVGCPPGHDAVTIAVVATPRASVACVEQRWRRGGRGTLRPAYEWGPYRERSQVARDSGLIGIVFVAEPLA